MRQRKVIFLDRDGVINKYPGDKKYVTSLEKLHFLPNVLKAIRRLTKAGYNIFVISNQAGVKKGIYSKKTLDDITHKMLKRIEGSGGKIAGVYYCLHAQEDNCACRKPKMGLVKKALVKLRIKNLKNKKTFLIGDDIRDIYTGRNAGLKTILVLSGREKLKNKNFWTIKPDYVFKNLNTAVDFILN